MSKKSELGTFSKINIPLDGKEFILQRSVGWYRCISWHPHYIMTDWCETKEEAIRIADKKIKEWYEKKGATMIDGKITISRYLNNRGDKEPIVIELEDQNAVVSFLKINMSLEDFAAAVTGMGNVPCRFEVSAIDKVGKLRLMDTLIFEIPEEVRWASDPKKIAELAIKACPEGWTANLYFDSQDSFFKKDGKYYAKCNIVKWIDKND